MDMGNDRGFIPEYRAAWWPWKRKTQDRHSLRISPPA